ncbi:PspC domain-containing protein [Reichenbachiella sp. MALMAid0571]|uniref:PspC domain-containing protein n=1 Tax=Reichenbachiella sp. MALMAid0571 TaxID=3143939 RepID=UPI0032DEAD6D
MKKNISINISGIIFHIEEDGYSKLKEYLESINSYFSPYEDSSEIIADIESRIAEIFLTKLDEGKQVVTIDDVEALIATMGTTADFEEIHEDEDIVEEAEPKGKSKSTEADEEPVVKRLFRNEKKRILGGVASGIAHYFGIDPLWIRLIILLLFLNVLFGPISGVVLIAYIILWIVIPGSHDLGEDKDLKKMYRNPENRVLGGVASGIAAYFGVDTTVIRLILVLTVFLGGSGLILYLILWIITPEANTITEKMQMQGKPVTLSNIEHNVKESLNVKEGEEKLFVKILLFPFRVIAAIFQALGKLLGPASRFIVEALRVIAGLFITGVGLAGMIGLIVATSVVFGFMSGWSNLVSFHDVPIELIRNSFPTFGYISIFGASFIPFLGIALIGISILVKKLVLNATMGWTIFGLWVLSMIGIGISVPKVVSEFSSEGEYRETRTYDFTNKNAILGLKEAGIEDYDMVNLKLRGHADSLYKLDMRYKSRGNSRKSSIENAEMINYNVSEEGSNLYFDSNLSLGKNAVFRAQELAMTLYVPYNQVFIMEENLKYIFSISQYGYKYWQMDANKWMFTENGLVCITCEDEPEPSQGKAEIKHIDDDMTFGEGRLFELEDFKEIEAKGNLNVVVSREDAYHVEVKGEDKYLDKVYVRKIGDVLSVEFDADKFRYLKSSKQKPVKVYISLPELKSIKGSGVTNYDISDFETSEFYANLSGASTADINIKSKNIEMKLRGASSVNLSGNTDSFEAEVSGASSLRAYDLTTRSSSIEASGASSAKIYARDKLYVEASGMSSVHYKGSPEVSVIDEDGLSSVKKDD